MNDTIPDRMNAVFTNPGNGQLLTRQVDVPKPRKGEVLIKMICAPVNPSDLARIKEITTEEAGDFIPGIEGCGTVVAAGPGILPRIFLGKRVACSSQYKTSGTWAEYMVTTAGSCFPVSKSIPDEQAAMMLVNPMTALAFLDYARKNRHKAVVMTAAASALANMAALLFAQHGIKVLNIVRSLASAEELQKTGRQHILSSSEPDFTVKFREWCRVHDARLMFDAVGGDMVNQLLDEMPPGSAIVLYGNLSGQKVEFLPPQLVRESKQLVGFFLGHWIHGQGMINTIFHLRKVNELLKKGMESRVQGVFSLDKVQEAVEAYEGNMGKGKVMIRVWDVLDSNQ